MNSIYRVLFYAFALTLSFFSGTAVIAGQLILKNTSLSPITCTVDGWTVSSGSSFDWFIKVQPGQSFFVGQNTSRPKEPVINWANCNNLQTRSMTITPSGPNQTLVLNGQQTQVLNVSLYPFLPTLPTDNFENLVAYVVQTYQSQHPQVLLNAVLNPQVNIYSFTDLPALLGNDGFDVMELDVLYLGFLADNQLINPAEIAGEAPLAVALAGATYQGKLWAIPSWLCMNFIYAFDQAIQQQKSLSQMLNYLNTRTSSVTKLVGSFNGSWTIPSDYINAYVQTYGYGALQQAMQMPPDNSVVHQLVSLSDTCTFNSINKCTNNTYHNAPNGGVEQVFASGQASTDMGFSEQSFYVNLYSSAQKSLYVVPTPWGEHPQPLLFEDAFVTSAATCKPGSQCALNAQAFTTLMTGTAMKNYIVQSKDLPAGTPWRTLLVATQQFWQQSIITDNSYYQQLSPIFMTAKAFPNNFTPESQVAMANGICNALKQQQPDFVCKSNNSTRMLAPSHGSSIINPGTVESRRGL